MEAYVGEEDGASHARFGRTARNAPMYGPPGRAYVYLVYGMHRCLNVVTEPPGRPAAVLVRAVRPLIGVAEMRAARVAAEARRARGRDPAAGQRITERLERVPDDRLASGPGLVCAAFDIEVGMTGLDLLDPGSELRIEAAPAGSPESPVIETPRIGVAYAGPSWSAVPWRFVLEGDPSVSGPPARAPGRRS